MYIKLSNKAMLFVLTYFIFFQLMANHLPLGFVYAKDLIPDIITDLRYRRYDNFTGRPVDGYLKPNCIMTKQAAEALKNVQSELRPLGFGLKIFDAYRPQQAVDCFARWGKDLKDIKMKTKYYPDVPKKDLFKDGYISFQSAHSRGSTVDLTIVSINNSGKVQELDMGTGFDFFSKKAWYNCLDITIEQKAHRMLLRLLMEKYGFEPYQYEWWHFTLKHEPFPNTYFNFPVE